MKSTKKSIISCIIFLFLLLTLRMNVFAAGVSINKTSVNLAKGESIALKMSGTSKKITWSSDKNSVATVNSSGKVIAKAKGTATISAKLKGSNKKYTCKVTVTNVPKITYKAHVQDIGWQNAVSTVDATSKTSAGSTAGTTGKGKRLEALKIGLQSPDGKNMISYRVHVSNVGWQKWVSSGQTAGTTGQAKAIEAVQIKLSGTYAKDYDIYYRMHVANKGWLGWAKNGAVAGSTGLALRGEAIQIKLVKKGTSVTVGKPASLVKPALSYKAHVQNIGWQSKANEGTTAGTTGKAKRLEALQIYLKNFDGGNGISYRAHVAYIGWQSWKSYGATAGTTGQGRAIEAIQIKLDSSLSSYFDIYYRIHVANYGWLGWAKNGEMAGTTGGGVQAEAIQIKLVNKGSSFNTNGTAYMNLSEIKLVHHMSTSLKQTDYSAFNFPYGSNKGCCALSYAIGLSIVNGKSYNPTAYWYGGTTHYDSGGVGGYVTFNASTVYNALKKGKPTMINYQYTGGGQHWVLIIGIRGGANVNSLSYGDFYAIDPATGTQVILTSSYKWTGCTVKGMRVFK